MNDSDGGLRNTVTWLSLQVILSHEDITVLTNWNQ